MYPIWKPFARYSPDSEEAALNDNNVNKESPKKENLGDAAQCDTTVTRQPLKRLRAEVIAPTDDEPNTSQPIPGNIVKRSNSMPISIGPDNQMLDGIAAPRINYNLRSPARLTGSFITNYITLPASPARSYMSNALSSPASSDDQRLIIVEAQVNCTPPPSASPARSYVSDTLRSPTSSDDQRLAIVDPRINQLLPNKLLRVYIQHGPRRQLRKFTFVMDSSLKVPFALDNWMTDNPVARVSERRYNTIFTENPTKRRIFNENGVLNLTNPSANKMALNGANTPTCRQRNRILTALDEIEYFLSCAVVKEQARLATRSITLVNALVDVWRADGPTFKILQAELSRLYADQTI
ncbi:unnamed protein product [Hermetia illucens]|uniref:Uncharacterized protein n=1 Tax=Hermetia illucens TaxID=343691 RepID=A0A7R8UH69_HERIL|nr:unnamed protein product [Hermetia illucens]